MFSIYMYSLLDLAQQLTNLTAAPSRLIKGDLSCKVLVSFFFRTSPSLVLYLFTEATLFLEGERNHPHCQMILTENRKRQIESEVEIEDFIGPGMWNIEVPGLAKEVQPMATVAVFFTDQDLVDRS